ncbi:unnamed protein product [Medioppia subpectinata]|uniref:C2H2-type domain-containing protein n=1 Tax=Medioppia subpectinata TaxID=1979941 RepID=A0A7R9Q752_9ACAR|nr:unnamed protein product [Medioppia subpectinata]CAG2115366.1 unnamed protein product [Medioppia subpectinata]
MQSQHHSCPYCQRGFTYLANYRKHIKSICPIRQQIDDKKQQVIDNSATDGADGSPATASKHLNTDLPPTLVFTPSSLSVRSQIEDTVLTLLRDQTKQDQILQSSEQLVKSKQSHRTDGQSSGGQHSDSDATDESREDTTRGDESKDSVKKEWTQSSATTTPTKGSSFRFRTFSCSICHKIFLSYVTMLKHRLSHKLSDGSAAAAIAAADDDSALSTTTHLSADDELVESNRDKEAANQALAASILKRSKDVIISKMRVHSTAAVGRSSAAKVTTTAGHKKVQTVINTTDLLEKLARGGITTDAIHQLSAATVPKTGRSCAAKGKEVITIETNNNDSQTFNLQLSASTSGANQMTTSDGSLDEMVIDGKHLTDVLKEGVIVAQDLQHLMTVSDGVVTGESSAGVVCDEGSAKCAEVLLNLDDMESGNEVWITITGDSSVLIQVPTTHTNHNSSPK